ncbi:unnamed protein product [Pipistrellus nathusii]|uniref:Uteroglobin n=1 Tax=Pipistrellus nathusii TaxID=59473 RepID=A0ABP0AGF2_PIPNA
MKLALPLLLVTLALCCPDANGVTMCPALQSEINTFLVGSQEEFQNEISKFNPPAEAMQDTLKVKTCVNKLSLLERLALVFVVQIVENKCKKDSA